MNAEIERLVESARNWIFLRKPHFDSIPGLSGDAYIAEAVLGTQDQTLAKRLGDLSVLSATRTKVLQKPKPSFGK